jgi:hypothetical protein
MEDEVMEGDRQAQEFQSLIGIYVGFNLGFAPLMLLPLCFNP